MKRISLRAYLGRLILLSVLPLLLLSGTLSWMYYESMLEERQKEVSGTAKNMATALGSQVRMQVEGLQLLSESPMLAPVLRTDEFYRMALSFRDRFGAHVILADEQLNMLLNTRVPLGTPLPKVPRPRSPGMTAVERALAEGRPAVSNLVDGPVASAPLLTAVVPVRRDGALQHLLIGTMETRRFQAYLDSLNLPEDWAIEMLDGAGGVIAMRRPAGFEALSEEDSQTLRIVAGIPYTRWSLVMQPSRAAVRAPLYAAGLTLFGALLAIGLVSVLGAAVAGQRLERAVSSLDGREPGRGVEIEEVESVRALLQRSAAALRAGESRYRMMFRSHPHPMWVFDRETLRILAVNEAAVAHYGYTEQEFLELTIDRIRPPEDMAHLRASLASLEVNDPLVKSTFRHLKKDGTLIDVEATWHRLEFNGRPAALVMCIDVTERLRAEQKEHIYLQRMERSLDGTVAAISKMMALRDPYTAGHERRVAKLASAIAAEMGLDADTQRGVEIAGGVHDVGKMSVPADILSKAGRLSSVEYEIVKTHPEHSYTVLNDIDFPWSVAEIARQHHERLDGSGYPRGLKGEEIMLEARILAVADTVEAMISYRPYRAELGEQAALEEIERGAGTLYDSEVVAACLRLFRERRYRIPD